MADQIKNVPDQKFVNADEFIEFLRVKRKNPCGSCDARDWTTVVPEEVHTVFISETQVTDTITEAGPVPTGDSDGGFGYLLLYCKNCGLIQHYAYTVVHSWISEQRKKSKE